MIDVFCQDTGQLFAVKVFSLLDREKRRQLDREIGTLLRSMQDGYVIHATVLLIVDLMVLDEVSNSLLKI